MSDQILDAPLPAMDGRQWHCALDTALDSPADVIEQERQIPLGELVYRVNPRSVVALEART
jgi:hypothetical protein